jgi:hypothetical protein
LHYWQVLKCYIGSKLSGIALGYWLDDWGFDSQKGLGIYLFITVTRPDLEPTQLPI